MKANEVGIHVFLTWIEWKNLLSVKIQRCAKNGSISKSLKISNIEIIS